MNERKVINDLRENFEKLGTQYPPPKDILVENGIIEGVNCYWIKPSKKNNSNRVIFYLHGGCFVFGSMKSHHALVSHLCKELEVSLLFIEYSLAPERPFPAANDDILRVYRYLIRQYDSSEIILMGDSAGASLALSLISNLNQESIFLPNYFVAISPWIDLSCSNSSLSENAGNDPILTKKALQEYTALYQGKNSISQINPIENIFGQFPPTLILVGSNEILLTDSEQLRDKILESNAMIVTLSVYSKQTHVWLLDSIESHESKRAIQEIKDFINMDR